MKNSKKKKIVSFYHIAEINTSMNRLYKYQLHIIEQLKKLSEKVFLFLSADNFDLDIEGVDIIEDNNVKFVTNYFNIKYEIILLKDTFLGFFCNLSNLYNYHIQSRKALLGLFRTQNYIFKDFFIVKGEYLSIEKYFSFCTGKFEFSSNDVKWMINSGKTELSLINDSLELVDTYELPILTLDCFYQSKITSINFNLCNELYRTIDFLQKNNLYDINLIIEFISNKLNIGQIKDVLNLNFIIDNKKISNHNFKKKVAVFAYLYYEDIFIESINYLKNVPTYVDIYIATDSLIKIHKIQQLSRLIKNSIHFIKVNPRGRDIAALLIEFTKYFGEYDYACFIHDKKSSYMGYTVGKNFRKILWDNTLYSKNYIEQIIKLFNQKDYLGLLVPPNVFHGGYFSAFCNYWGVNYSTTKILLQKFGNVPCSATESPISVGSVFWFRTSALKKLNKLNLSNEDFPCEPFPNDGSIAHAIERIFPYVAQSEGLLTATIYNAEYAANEISTLRAVLQNFVSTAIGNDLTDKVYTFEKLKEILKR